MRMIILILIGFMSVAAPAWAGEDQFLGTVFGAGVGGYVGSQFGRGSGQVAATGAGILVGGVAGNAVGRSLDQNSYASQGYGAPGFFSDPPPAYYGARYVPNYVAPPDPPTPTTYIDSDSGGYCRDFSQETRIGNQVSESYGTACLQPDGTWRVVQ